MNFDHVLPLIAQLEQRDLSTAAHTWRVVLYTRALAERFEVSDELMHQLTLGAALHDVGKLDIPLDLLQKPGTLTDEEYEIVKLHTVAGFARLVDLGVEDEPILDLVRYHHERWDGRGYPFGLAGEDIPIPARFFAVIDAFDAMTSVRPYRHDIGREAGDRAAAELEAGKATRYWPDAVEAFLTLYRTRSLDWILEYFNDSAPLPAFTNTPHLRKLRGDRSELDSYRSHKS